MLAQCEHGGPYLFAAKALVLCMLQQGLIGTGAPIRHPRALRTYARDKGLGIRAQDLGFGGQGLEEIYWGFVKMLGGIGEMWQNNGERKFNGNLSLFDYSTGNPTQSDLASQFIIITYYYIL